MTSLSPSVALNRWFAFHPVRYILKPGNRSLLFSSCQRRYASTHSSQNNRYQSFIRPVRPKGVTLGDQGTETDFSKHRGILGLSSILLRDACRCTQCVDPSTHQRNFSFFDIPANVEAIPESSMGDDILTVAWKNDIPGLSSHRSVFTKDEIDVLLRIKPPFASDSLDEVNPWNKLTITGRLLEISFTDYMNADEQLFKAMDALQRDGLIFVKGVPPLTDSVQNLVERIGPLKSTFYGSTWDVHSKPNAENVAYTDKDLGFHMDLLYMREPPAFQFLHCIHNTCEGGESLFSDTAKAKEIMLAENRNQADLLYKHFVIYRYDNFGHIYNRTWPVFTPSGVYWSPPFVGKFSSSLSHAALRRNLLAAKRFADILNRKDLIYETKMNEGTCAIFRNTRVVHARNAFDTRTGHRWLRGAYLDSQPFRSRYIALRRQFAEQSRK